MSTTSNPGYPADLAHVLLIEERDRLAVRNAALESAHDSHHKLADNQADRIKQLEVGYDDLRTVCNRQQRRIAELEGAGEGHISAVVERVQLRDRVRDLEAALTEIADFSEQFIMDDEDGDERMYKVNQIADTTLAALSGARTADGTTVKQGD